MYIFYYSSDVIKLSILTRSILTNRNVYFIHYNIMNAISIMYTLGITINKINL